MSNKTSLLALIISIIALVIVVMRPAGQENAPAKQETVFERVMRTRTIRCGYAVWNPVMYKDANNGKLGGIAYDLMEAIGKNLDLKIDWAEEGTWGTIVEGLATHRYDMICNGMAVVGARAQAIDFSRSYFYGPAYFVIRADENRLQHIADLENPAYRIVLLDGEASALTVPKHFPKAQYYSMPQNTDWSLILQEVQNGKADATAVDMSNFIRYNKANPGKLKLLNPAEPLQVYSVAFGLPQGDVAFKALIDAAISDLTFDGSVERFVHAHTDPDEFFLSAKPYILPSQ